jgi:predicted AAA+ superfamily ATPase
MFGRWVEGDWRRRFASPYVHVVFGARQTGKSTLLRALWPDAAVWIDFSDPAQRSEYLRRPETLIQRCRALPGSPRPAHVVVDEAQSVPAVFDAVQHLYHSERRRYRFVLCGSSARKLRVSGANLLPWRSLKHRLFPLVLGERPTSTRMSLTARASPLALPARRSARKPFPAAELEERLLFGELPGIALAASRDRAPLLRAYGAVYLEEELRREALVKDWPAFARFLQLAAAEAGRMINYAAVSRQAGVSLPP